MAVLVSLLCRSLSHCRGFATIRPSIHPTITFSTSFPSPSHARASLYSQLVLLSSKTTFPPLVTLHSLRLSFVLPRTTTPLLPQSYFSSATNAKLKRISPILSVNMPVQLQHRGGQTFLPLLSPSFRFLPLFPTPSPVIPIWHSTRDHMYMHTTGVRRMDTRDCRTRAVRQLGRRAVLLFHERLLVNSDTDAPARTVLRDCGSCISRSHKYAQMSQKTTTRHDG